MQTKYQQVGYNKTLENIKFWGAMMVLAGFLIYCFK
jgi:hypothetical protein